MTGVLQTYARKNKISIDKLIFSFKVMENEDVLVNIKPTEGVFIYGLYLEGASWDKKKK